VIKTRTKEGLELSLHASFQYKIIKDKLPKLYRLYETDYERKITRIARKAILKVSADYKAFDYWLNRTRIGKDMLTKVK
jgi:hypothetical protein